MPVWQVRTGITLCKGNTAQKCTGSYITLFRSRQRSNPFRIPSAFRSPACQLASFVSGNPNSHFCSSTTSARFVLPSTLMSPEITGGSVAVVVVVLVAAAVVVFVVALIVVVVVTVVVTLVVAVVVSVFVCHFCCRSVPIAAHWHRLQWMHRRLLHNRNHQKRVSKCCRIRPDS